MTYMIPKDFFPPFPPLFFVHYANKSSFYKENIGSFVSEQNKISASFPLRDFVNKVGRIKLVWHESCVLSWRTQRGKNQR